MRKRDFAAGEDRNRIVKALTGEVRGAHLPFVSKKRGSGLEVRLTKNTDWEWRQ